MSDEQVKVGTPQELTKEEFAAVRALILCQFHN
jgi:hypothetical protein